MLDFFLPDWEDRLDPEFDFINDAYSENHNNNPYENDVYAHQIFKNSPYNGILLSLSIFQSKISLINGDNDTFKIKDYTDIKKYLKITPESKLQVMGDCGAFGYVAEEEPPLPFYSVKHVANIYEKLKFDLGVSVDHLVVDYIMEKNKKGEKKKRKLKLKEKKRRVEITRDNADAFYSYHKEQKHTYVPIGVAQGYNLNSYAESVANLVEIGYDYIAIGSLVSKPTSFIINILKKIKRSVKGKKIHLFGVIRPESLEDFHKLGVTSIDSASFLRKAWLRSGQNYLDKDGQWFTAIRVPQSENKRLLKNADINGYTVEDLKRMEQTALAALVQYDRGELDIESTLDSVINYDELLIRNGDIESMREKYRRTLIERPWGSCDCEICKNIGIQSLIFRGCNRNKRRGFHNTWTLTQRIMPDKLQNNSSG
jgi:queuine/archaeosine tRNA-ribosyltransferase